jgi:hypothetical protein
MSQGSLLALSGERKLPILVRDLPGIRLEIGRLLPQQLQHLVTQTNGDFSHPQFYGGLSRTTWSTASRRRSRSAFPPARRTTRPSTSPSTCAATWPTGAACSC